MEGTCRKVENIHNTFITEKCISIHFTTSNIYIKLFHVWMQRVVPDLLRGYTRVKADCEREIFIILRNIIEKTIYQQNFRVGRILWLLKIIIDSHGRLEQLKINTTS